MMWPWENTYRGTGSSGTQKKYPSENDIQVKPAGSLYDPAQIGTRQKDILVNPEFSPSLQANPGACFYDPAQIGTRQKDILVNPEFSPSLQANPGACFYDPAQIGTRQKDILVNPVFSPPQATATGMLI